MLWINFLHFYQPANADAFVIREATEKSYDRVVRALEEHLPVKFTLNISGCLLMRWEELGYSDLIRRLGDLARAGRIELTGSAAYHPLLPLVSDNEIRTQIRENEEILRKYFGPDLRPRGFFLPEMAYSPRAARIIADLGYQWIILDELAVRGRIGQGDHSRVWQDGHSGLQAVTRSRQYSSGFVPELCARSLFADSPDQTIVSATDGELYGLRHIDPTGEFEKFLKHPDLATMTVSEYIDTCSGEAEEIFPRKHSWETSVADYAQNRPFLVWQDPDNELQAKLWRFYGWADRVLERNRADANYAWARWHFVRGLASCTWWWASGRDFKHIFGPIAWNPDQVNLGANEFVRAVRALDDAGTRQDKLKAEKMWLRIKEMIWGKHWREYWKK